jgi:hypothetical protein
VDQEAERVNLLLAEKAYIEQRINSNLGLQQKVLGAGLTAVITALGWVFSANVCTASGSIILLSIVSISAVSVLMTVVYGGFALGAIRFKEDVLGEELQSILATKSGVFGALRATSLGVAGRPIAFATTFLCLAHIGLSITVYVGALVRASGSHPAWPLKAGAVVAGFLLAGSIVGLAILARAIRKSEAG